MKLKNLDVFEDMEELEDFMQKRDAEMEQWRCRKQCCSNCRNRYEEEGQQFCKKCDDVLEDTDEEKCEDWI